MKKLERIEQALTGSGASSGNVNNASMMALAGQITALTEHMREEQKLVKRMAENQEAIAPLLERLAARMDK
jgi:hypothetical protein